MGTGVRAAGSATFGRIGAWSRSLPEVSPVLWAFLIGLPIHTFAMMVLFGALGVPGRVISILDVWKEVLALLVAGVLIAMGLLKAASVRTIKLTYGDALIILFGLWILARTAWGLRSGAVLPMIADVYGLRFYAVPLALYAIGRLAPLPADKLQRIYWALTILGGVTGAIAVAERLIPDAAFSSLLHALGYQTYYANFVHAQLIGPGKTAASMWIYTIGHFVRRAGSIYMISKPFALTYLVIIPVALSLLGSEQRRAQQRWLQILLVLCWAGLLLSLTRAPIVACIALALGAAVAFRQWKPLLSLPIGLSVGVGVLLIGVAISPATTAPGSSPSSSGSTPGQVLASEFSGSDSSSVEHGQVWTRTLKVALERPLTGWGVGTGNEDSQRFVSPSTVPVTLGAENLFLQVLEELGIVGLALYVGICCAFLVRSLRYLRSASEQRMNLGLVLGLSTLGICAVAVTTPFWQGAFIVTYFYWWIAGQANADVEIGQPATERHVSAQRLTLEA